MPLECPDPSLLTDYAAGILPEDGRAGMETHLSSCGGCRNALSRFHAAEEGRVAPRWPLRAAAALLLAAGLAAAWIGSRVDAERPSPTSPKPANLTGSIALPDGTQLRIAAGASAHFAPPQGVERFHLVLEQGEIEADVATGGGRFRISTPAGHVRVMGTRLSVRAVRFPFDPDPLPATVVEVVEGSVLLSTPQGEVRIPAGHRGVLAGSLPPVGPIHLAAAPAGGLLDAVRLLSHEETPGRNWETLLPIFNAHRRGTQELLSSLPTERDPRTREMIVRVVTAIGTEEEAKRWREKARE